MIFPIVCDKKLIENYLPHRYNALMLDEGTILSPLSSTGSFKFTMESYPMFKGHFPDLPTVRGVDLCEAIGLTASLIINVIPEFKGLIGVFREITQAKFKVPVIPNDTLQMFACITSTRITHGIASGEFEGRGEVNGNLCVLMKGKFVATSIDKIKSSKNPHP
jgi:3-hydroxyacyl-[acyl-carrier-protein] dehydratase